MVSRKISVLGVAVLTVALMAGCCSKENGTKAFTAYIAVAGMDQPDDNRLMNKIADKTGGKVQISWLTGQSASERINSMISSQTYPDFIDGSDATSQLVDAGALIALDEYLPEYPNLQNYLTEKQWNSLRQQDGHIYYIPQFGVIQGEDMSVHQGDEAFWIQKRVLKWAGYPKIKTLDEYFDLIDAYMEANPTDEEGNKNIGFEILCDDWKYFCLENVPQFLAGYPNDGCAIVDPETLRAHIYDDIPEAEQYYRKLCEEYNKGNVDPETFTISYSEYIEKLTSGSVLGMVDQYWDFMVADNLLYGQGKVECTYVPLGIVADESITPAYRSQPALNVGSGIGISVDCKDVEGALKFMNDLLSPEIMTLRFWGEEGIDYEVGEDGVYYRTEEQRANANNDEYANENKCNYVYFPHYEGMMEDGINAIEPGQQPGEYYSTLGEVDREVLDAYGYEKWADFLTPVKKNADWYPLYSETNQWTSDTEYGKALEQMNEVKHLWLPKVIMSPVESFEDTWKEYQEIYQQQVNVKAYEGKLSSVVKKRVQAAMEGEENKP